MTSLCPITSSITVAIRKRPIANNGNSGDKDIVTCEDCRTISVHEPKTRVDLKAVVETSAFAFDYVFDESVANDVVYKVCCQPLLTDVQNGGSVVVIAFGQTGSGKTHTMLGHGSKTIGLYGYAIRELIGEETTRKLAVSFYEVYGSKLFDLLNGRTQLKMMQDEADNLRIVGLSEKVVTCDKEVYKLISKGESLRSSGSTLANDTSSRSHAVLEIKVLNYQGEPHGGRVTLIDLAGSERAADTTSSDTRGRHEGAEINKSLLALKECIRAMSRNRRHIPFRASKLTQVLRESFIGNCKTCFIATVSPLQRHCEDTLNTLRYANRIRDLKAPSDDGFSRKISMTCPNCNGPVRPDASHTCVRLSTRCPHCRQVVEKHNLEGHIEECSEFPVRCPRCNELLVRGDIPRHNRRCSRSLVRCPLCTCHVMRCGLEKHTLMDCGAKLEKCRYCGQGFPRHSLKRHEDVCTMMKIACPYCLQYFRKVCVDAHASVCVRNPNCRRVSPSRIRDSGEEVWKITNGKEWRQRPRMLRNQSLKQLEAISRTKSSVQLREGRKPLGPLEDNFSLPALHAPSSAPDRKHPPVTSAFTESLQSHPNSEDDDADKEVCRTAPTISGENSSRVGGEGCVCPYAAYGCLHTVCDSSLEKHMKDSVEMHLQLVRDYAERVSEENNILRERVNEGTTKASKLHELESV
ncbi:MCAK-like kinesin, putative [Trypanosoma brucei gambiense DAL972]|uniref:Kinesin-like protein n=1 Tax=Trypanosoma brucei gambiense (strain MHOM/CI/86/DAL972) TaxID=679716 RepID=D0A6W1_TRYB9|nr:MCAK-like kinesin, putative [Trypanosoma brucei gambiense DAL972]CBH17412.1 MCAK-like kinesin, putative [Trypanosoma brucei gambiense DAL972]|eukprot:XP_011779676.1 MCAK-like kinesin, putative [Trypanosoma brucei gambiense DAL972]